MSMLSDPFLLSCLAALVAALCWSITPFVSFNPSKRWGATTFGLVRQFFAGFILLIVAFFVDGFSTLRWDYVMLLLLSGLVGIFVGDGLLFAGLRRLGPRRNQLIFATNAPMTALLGFIFLSEILTIQTYFGIIIVFIGVGIAIFFKEKRSLSALTQHQKTSTNPWEKTLGPAYVGICYAFLAALGQAIGILIIRPVMEGGHIDPFAASTVRIGAAGFAFLIFSMIKKEVNFKKLVKEHGKNVFISDLIFTLVSAILGMALGMTFILIALKHAPSGVVATLSATSPVIVLFILWWVAKNKPHPFSWIGAVLTVIGTALIVY